MLVQGPYPPGEPRVEREVRAAPDAGWDDVLAVAESVRTDSPVSGGS
jgi:hypothetical protein